LTETLHFLGGLRLVVYGILLILIMGFLPQGIAGGLRLATQYYEQRRAVK
jgi:ABC-type branched-subunit amino acid transport system permease subunit